MIDNIYKNALKEVSDILENTDTELIDKIPSKFIKFIHENMNNQYETNIKLNIDIDKQPLLKETEAILSLIYRSYWATDEEKIHFAEKDKLELAKYEEKKKEKYTNIEEIFEKRKNLNKVTLDNNLVVVRKENLFTKILKKIKNMLKK